MLILRVWMLGKQDQKRAELIGDEEEEKGGGVEADRALGEVESGFMEKWRNASRWWRYAKV